MAVVPNSQWSMHYPALSISHNEIRDLTAVMSASNRNYSRYLEKSSPMPPRTLRRVHVWTLPRMVSGRFERTFFDVLVFNPHAPSHKHSSLVACYRKQEMLKKKGLRTANHGASQIAIFHLGVEGISERCFLDRSTVHIR